MLAEPKAILHHPSNAHSVTLDKGVAAHLLEWQIFAL